MIDIDAGEMDYATLFRRVKAATADEREAQAVVRMILDVGMGISWADALCGRLDSLSPMEQKRLEDIVRQVEEGQPVQYALGRTAFCGRLFEVSPAVLIPRPETEELCRWVEAPPSVPKGSVVLDIGTGSGCIAITLALDLPQAEVEAWDISSEALAVARRNAKRLGANVVFRQVDILALSENPDTVASSPLGGVGWEACPYDMIVSNPPYICEREQAEMEPHVLDHEPHEALFVPDNDPLLFYRTIALFAKHALKPSGKLYFEVNAQYAEAVRNLLLENNYQQVAIRKDAFGKPRFVRASHQ